MAVNTSTFESTLQTKLDNVTDPKEMLLLGKALESTVGSIAVSDIQDEGTTQTNAVNTAGTTKVGEVNSAGSTQVTAVNNAGTTQVNEVNTTGASYFPSQTGNSGNFLQTDGSSLSWASASAGLKSQQVFTSSGTWTKPAGINLIKVYVTGGGGGGGASNMDDGGGGGGAGATAIKVIDVSTISSVSVTVGTGGSGIVNNGSLAINYAPSSSFGSYCTAIGGSPSSGSWSSGGRGGSATGGDINIYGGDGEGGHIDQNANGHGAGGGGASYWGSGGAGQCYWMDGQPGRAYGSGGSGGYRGSTGKSGAPGVVVVEEYA